jgi:hypothetical protein
MINYCATEKIQEIQIPLTTSIMQLLLDHLQQNMYPDEKQGTIHEQFGREGNFIWFKRI